MIRLGKYDHGLNMFLTVKDYEKEQAKRDENYRRRKEMKKVKLMKEKPKSKTIIKADHKIKKAENNIKRKFEGKEMIPDEKKDELELIRERIKDLEEKLKLKYKQKGMANKKIKIRIKEDPEEIKKINQEIKMSKKHLEDLRRQRKEIELEKLKYHSFSSMASLPQYPPKRILSEMPIPDEIDDDAIIASKEKMMKKKIKKTKRVKKEKNLKDKKENDINEEKKEEEKTKNENEENKEATNKDEILSLNKNKNDENENMDKNEEGKEDEKEEEEKKESNLNSSWETYDSKDPEGIKKKEKEELDKKNKEKKEKKNRELQKLLIKKRIKEIEKRMELLPEETKKQKRMLEKEKKKIEMLDKGVPLEEIEKFEKEIMNSENKLITEENDSNINNETTKNEELPEENLSEMEEKDDEEKISEIKTQNEIIKVKKKKVKDEFFKNILKKKYKFKYMRLFYEEYPYNFSREYSIISFNDLFTSNDFFYYYSDVEINDMIYRRALKEDRRSFCLMYWSFIKYKNNFIFCVTKDYFNMIIVKIALLVYSLSIYPFFSCLFINDKVIHAIYTESYNIQKKTILRSYSISIVQYIFTPIIIELIIFLLKKFILTEKDIIEFIHKKKYHTNYILQEMVKGHDVRDVRDEQEKKEILLSIQNMNKNKKEKQEEKDAFFAIDDNELKKQQKPDYDKEFEENKTLINEIRMEMGYYHDKINNRITFFFIGAFILSLFHFYYVTVFTMVYYNCVEKIIFGTLLPLGINILYPFVNCFVFVSIRYFSLNQGFINLYKFSKILSYL